MIKNSVKTILLAVSLVLCTIIISSCAVSVKETVDHYRDVEEVKNVFTIGEVDITIDEEGAEAFVDGSYGQTYEDIVPNEVYPKASKVNVEKGSLESYVRMMVTVKFEKALDDSYLGEKLDNIFKGTNDEKWILNAKTIADDKTSVVYEYRYATTVSAPDAAVELEPVFTGISFSGAEWGNELKDLDNLQINVEGHAIQAENFSGADEAWEAFNR